MQERYEALRLRNQLCFPIYLCSKELTRKYGALLEELDLTYTQYVVMMFFWEQGRSNVKELGKTLMLDPSTLTPILKKLEAKGYITRTRSQSDERNLTVAITEKGDELKEAALRVHDEMCGCIGLSGEESQTLYKLIAKLLANVEMQM
ncbi:MAG: MarR family transcriptional regulator [Ruminiclostridium sp.]|nr:MarR family transcriptional regulator [Ruminiclostridium sp.]